MEFTYNTQMGLPSIIREPTGSSLGHMKILYITARINAELSPLWLIRVLIVSS